jgi:hypothetical protein
MSSILKGTQTVHIDRVCFALKHKNPLFQSSHRSLTMVKKALDSEGELLIPLGARRCRIGIPGIDP